ncbi:MAG: COG1361 S-layer family protein [Nanobdellota archaeon]
MKKIIMLIAIIMVMPLALAANNTIDASPFRPQQESLKATFINQDPDPARPGEYVDLKIRIDNMGQETAKDVEVNFVETYPFALDASEEKTKNLGNIGAFNEQDYGTIIEYKVRVDSKAVEGDNKAKISLKSTNKNPVIYEFDVEVKTVDAGLIVENVETEPSQLTQGSKGTLRIDLENPSDSVLREVTVSLDLSDDNLLFAPIESASTKKLNYLNPGKTSTFRFGLMPFPEAQSKVYRIPITISYYDSTNKKVEKSELIGVIVGSEPDINFYSENFEVENGNKGTLTINSVNKGLIDVKFLNIKLENTDDYEILSSKEYYVGSVDSDDFETAEFDMNIKTEKNKFNIKGNVEYRDANNKLFTKEINFPIRINNTKSESSFNWLYLVFALIISFIGYKIWKKKKGMKR